MHEQRCIQNLVKHLRWRKVYEKMVSSLKWLTIITKTCNLYVSQVPNMPIIYTGAQPDIFQGRRVFGKLGHSDKQFVKNPKKKAAKNFEVFYF